jgi:hypothetical protein
MATGIPSTVFEISTALSRQTQETVNNQKTGNFLDFAFAAFLSIDLYFQEMGDIYVDILDDNKTIVLGTEVDITTLGGNLALSVAMDVIQARRDSMEGLAKAGLKNENKLWTLR